MPDNADDLKAPSDWHPTTDQQALAVLGKLIEELNECGTAAARCIIQGIDEAEPVTKFPNRRWLENEIADVFAMCNLVGEHFGLDSEYIDKRSWQKITHKLAWLELLKKQD